MGDGRGDGVVRHEEQLAVETVVEPSATVHARKRIDVERVRHEEPCAVEEADFERVPGADGDSGEVEVLPDGSVSIPLLEERLVVTKQVVVRERVIVRKRTITEHERIEADLRRERIDLDADGRA